MPGVYDSTQVGQREDLENMLYSLEAETTPATSLISKSTEATNDLFEWQAELQARPDLEGAIEGKDLSEFGAQDRIAMAGRTMIMEEGWKVTNVADTTAVAAVNSERAKQKAEALRRLKIKLERFILSSLDSRAGTGTLAARTRGIFSWLDTSAQSDTTTAVHADLRARIVRPSLTIATLTESQVSDDLAEAFKHIGTGVNLIGLNGIDYQKKVDSFSVFATDRSGRTPVQLRSPGDQKRYIECIKFLDFSAGTVELHPTRDLAVDINGDVTDATHRSAVYINPKVWKIRTKAKIKHIDLVDGGGGPRGLFQLQAGVQCGTPIGQIAHYITADS